MSQGAEPAGDIGAALAHHRAGRTAEARALYDSLIAARPDDVNALHLRQ